MGFHYHVDRFEFLSGKWMFVEDTKPITKRQARREFFRIIDELSKQVGRFNVIRHDENFPGAIRVAMNHRIAIALTKCDCGGEEDEQD